MEGDSILSNTRNPMKTSKFLPLAALAAAASLSLSGPAGAVIVSVQESSAPWFGFMNVSNLPADGGAFQFGSPWGVPDLVATFDDGAQLLTLSPNSIGDPDPYWYKGGGGPGAQGNKIMEANLYIQEDGPLAGQNVIFAGNILGDSTTSAHQGFIFIKDFAPDFSSSVDNVVPITPGPFSISLTTINDPARHVQYGFQFVGENVWVTDTAPFGNIQIGTVPEPSTALLGLIGVAALLRRRR